MSDYARFAVEQCVEAFAGYSEKQGDEVALAILIATLTWKACGEDIDRAEAVLLFAAEAVHDCEPETPNG